MFLKISIDKKQKEIKINGICGKSFSLFYKLNHKIFGSPKYKILNTSPHLAHLKKSNDTICCNLELRKKGVVLYFRFKQDEYAICGRYNQTVFQSSDNIFEIQIANDLIKAEIHHLKSHHKFIANFLKLKNESINFKYD